MKNLKEVQPKDLQVGVLYADTSESTRQFKYTVHMLFELVENGGGHNPYTPDDDGLFGFSGYGSDWFQISTSPLDIKDLIPLNYTDRIIAVEKVLDSGTTIPLIGGEEFFPQTSGTMTQQKSFKTWWVNDQIKKQLFKLIKG